MMSARATRIPRPLEFSTNPIVIFPPHSLLGCSLLFFIIFPLFLCLSSIVYGDPSSLPSVAALLPLLCENRGFSFSSLFFLSVSFSRSFRQKKSTGIQNKTKQNKQTDKEQFLPNPFFRSLTIPRFNLLHLLVRSQPPRRRYQPQFTWYVNDPTVPVVQTVTTH